MDISGDENVQNTLSKKEEQEGWKLLFDGKTTTGWRNYNSSAIGTAWKVVEGTLMLDIASGEKGGDIITENVFENFEFVIEWKISQCGNSGIMFNVVEDLKYENTWVTGPEMQILDNDCHPDARFNKHRAGDLYGLLASTKDAVRPAGEWNHVKIISAGGDYQFWLNGENVVQFSMHTPEWLSLVQNSKFKEFADFGKARRGHISLQDHDDTVWFRNIKIKTI